MDENQPRSRTRKTRSSNKQDPTERKRKRPAEAPTQKSGAPRKKAKDVKNTVPGRRTTQTSETIPTPLPLDFPLSQTNKYIPCFGRKKKASSTSLSSGHIQHRATRSKADVSNEKRLESNENNVNSSFSSILPEAKPQDSSVELARPDDSNHKLCQTSSPNEVHDGTSTLVLSHVNDQTQTLVPVSAASLPTFHSNQPVQMNDDVSVHETIGVSSVRHLKQAHMPVARVECDVNQTFNNDVDKNGSMNTDCIESGAVQLSSGHTELEKGLNQAGENTISYSPQVSLGFNNPYCKEAESPLTGDFPSVVKDEDTHSRYELEPCANTSVERDTSQLSVELENNLSDPMPVTHRHCAEERNADEMKISAHSDVLEDDADIADAAVFDHGTATGLEEPAPRQQQQYTGETVKDMAARSTPEHNKEVKHDRQMDEPKDDCGDFMELTDSQLCSYDDAILVDKPASVPNVLLVAHKPTHRAWKPEPRFGTPSQRAAKLRPDPDASRNIRALIEELSALSEMMKQAKQELHMPVSAMPVSTMPVPQYQPSDFSGYQQ